MNKLIIVIVSWNTADLTRDCLTSTYEELARIDVPSEIWVVDNDSHDGSVPMIREKFPQVVLIENAENTGFARANNQALRKAEGSMYLLLNSDTVVKPGGIGNLVAYLGSHPEIAAVGPRLVLRNGSYQRSIWPLPSLGGEFRYCLGNHFSPFGATFSKVFAKRRRRYDTSVITSAQEAEVLSAACLLVRKEVFDKIGYLEEEYFLFSEENDFFFRMHKAGFRAAYVPEAEVIHLVGQSRKQRSELDSEINFLKSRLIYFRRTGSHSLWLVRGVYRFFLWWSYQYAKLSYRVRGSYNPKYIDLYRQLRRTLSETH